MELYIIKTEAGDEVFVGSSYESACEAYDRMTSANRPGRPPKPESERLKSVTIRLPIDLIERLDAIGERSTVIRDILKHTLK